MIFKVFAAALAFVTVACAPPAPERAAAPAATVAAAEVYEPVDIVTAQGVRHFRARIADDPAEREHGLMFVSVLPEDEGMLFDFGEPSPRAFWMKNTLIPLDIIFISPGGQILRIEANTVPMSLDPVGSGDAVEAVLELAGGRAAELGIAAGDKVEWR